MRTHETQSFSSKVVAQIDGSHPRKIDLKLSAFGFRHIMETVSEKLCVRVFAQSNRHIAHTHIFNLLKRSTMFAVFNEPYEKFIKRESNNRKMYIARFYYHYINKKKERNQAP